MPLPLIPIAIIGGAALLTGGGLSLNAQSKIKKAKAEHEAAYNAYKVKFDNYKAYHAGTEKRLQEVGQARADGMQTIREAIAFIKKAKLANPNIISDAEVTVQDLESLDQAYGNILKTLGGAGASVAGGAGAGALTALGAYGLVGALGTASTGAAIGGLSGAAASSATLAWFGGGALAAGGLGIAGGTAVLGGIVAAPAIIGFGVFRQIKSGKVQKEATEKIQEIKAKEAEIGRDQVRLQTVRQRCNEVQLTVRELTAQLKVALHNASPNIAEDVYRIVQIAKALRGAIDEPVVSAGSGNRPAHRTCANSGCDRQASVGMYCTGHRHLRR